MNMRREPLGSVSSCKNLLDMFQSVVLNSIDSCAASAGWSCFGHTQNVLLCTPNVWTKVLLHTHNGGTNILLCTPNVWTHVLLCTTNICTKVLLHTHRECVAPRVRANNASIRRALEKEGNYERANNNEHIKKSRWTPTDGAPAIQQQRRTRSKICTT